MLAIFDSGVGGLSIWREIIKLNPQISSVYLADQLYFPYGNLDLKILKKRTKKALNFFIKKKCQHVLIACNTVTVNYPIDKLRQEYPQINFFGVEPPIELLSKKNKKSIILVTPKTAKSQYLKSKIKNSNSQIKIIEMNHLAKAIEFQNDSLLDESLAVLKKFKKLKNLTIGLGCTHYFFAKENISKYFNDDIEILDVSSFVAKQVLRNITVNNLNKNNHQIFTTSENPDQLAKFIDLKFGLDYKVKKVVL